MSTVKFLSITSKDRHNAHVYLLIHVSLETINSSTYMLDCPGPAVTQLLYMRHMLNVCSQSVESWQQAREIGQLNPSRKKIMLKMNLKYTHPFNGPFPGLPRWAGTRKVKPIWILLKQETVSGSGISWVICKSAPRSRQITMPAPHHSFFYRPDALPAAQPTASKHWRHWTWNIMNKSAKESHRHRLSKLY